MKFSQHLIGTIRKVRKTYPLLNLTDRDVFVRNLVFVYHVIKGSENLLRVASERSEAGSSLHQYLVEHLSEEREHEAWLAADLETAGIDVTRTIVPRIAVEMVGSQYYLIFHVDPAALLGYMAVLECFPTPIADIEALEAVHGTNLLRTSRYHAEHDLDHGAVLLSVIDQIPEGRQQIVLESAIQAAVYLGAALSQIQ